MRTHGKISARNVNVPDERRGSAGLVTRRCVASLHPRVHIPVRARARSSQVNRISGSSLLLGRERNRARGEETGAPRGSREYDDVKKNRVFLWKTCAFTGTRQKHAAWSTPSSTPIIRKTRKKSLRARRDRRRADRVSLKSRSSLSPAMGTTTS